MPAFLGNGEILNAIKDVIDGGDDCRLAVAYWGLGAAERIGIKGAKGEVQIICDPWGGACSKEELLALCRTPNVRLRHLKDLHAKVYLSSKGAVVGSANASTKGLGKANGKTINHEAAVRFGAGDDRNDIRDWFSLKWKHAYPLIEKDVIARVPDPPKPSSGARISRPTVLEVMSADPGWFQENRVRILVYDPDDTSDAAWDLYQKHAGEIYEPITRKDYEDRGPYPFFEVVGDWTIEPSDIFICFQYSAKRNKNEWDGIWTLKDLAPVTDGSTTIVFLDGHRKVRGLRLPRYEIKTLTDMVRDYMRANGIHPDDFGNLIDMNLADFFERSVIEDPWLEKLYPEAKKKIVDFAARHKEKVEKILIGKTGKGTHPNFRLQFKTGVKDYDGMTFDPKTLEFRELKGGIKNPKNLAELTRA